MSRQTGLVVRIDAKRCHVEVEGKVHLLSPRGKLYTEKGEAKNPVAVGDRVLVTLDGQGGGGIEDVLPRTTKLARASAGEGSQEQVLVANVDLVLVVTSIRDPSLRPALVDRILAGAERGGVEAHLVINKIDLERPDEEPRPSSRWQAFYESLGYASHLCSALAGQGIDELRNLLGEHLTVFCGRSGVGKSSILNAIEPGLSLDVGEVSQRWRQGRHTTTHSSLLRLSSGGHVVDTPGIRNFGLFGVRPAELAALFREFRPYLGQCAFNDCLHWKEPDCAIKAAKERDEISDSRYESYVELLRGASVDVRD